MFHTISSRLSGYGGVLNSRAGSSVSNGYFFGSRVREAPPFELRRSVLGRSVLGGGSSFNSQYLTDRAIMPSSGSSSYGVRRYGQGVSSLTHEARTNRQVNSKIENMREKNRLQEQLSDLRVLHHSDMSDPMRSEISDAIIQVYGNTVGDPITPEARRRANAILNRTYRNTRFTPPVTQEPVRPQPLSRSSLLFGGGFPYRVEDTSSGGLSRHVSAEARDLASAKQDLKDGLVTYGIPPGECDGIEASLSGAGLEARDYRSLAIYLEKVKHLSGAESTMRNAFQQMKADTTLAKDVATMVEDSLSHCVDSKAEVLTRIQVRSALASIYQMDRNSSVFMEKFLEKVKQLHHDSVFDEVFNHFTYTGGAYGEKQKLIDNDESTEIRGRYKLILEKEYDFSSKMPNQKHGDLGLIHRDDVLIDFKSAFEKSAKSKSGFLNYVNNLVQHDEKLKELVFPKNENNRGREEEINETAYELMEAIEEASDELGSDDYKTAMDDISTHREKLLQELAHDEERSGSVNLDSEIEKRWSSLLAQTRKKNASSLRSLHNYSSGNRLTGVASGQPFRVRSDSVLEGASFGLDTVSQPIAGRSLRRTVSDSATAYSPASRHQRTPDHRQEKERILNQLIMLSRHYRGATGYRAIEKLVEVNDLMDRIWGLSRSAPVPNTLSVRVRDACREAGIVI